MGVFCLRQVHQFLAADNARMSNGRHASFTVTVQPAGLQFATGTDQTLLEAALLAQVVLPSSCRNGTCRACMCKLVSGSVTYTIAWPGLLPEEKADGYVLPCVARATADAVLFQPDVLGKQDHKTGACATRT
jgi:ferredoxin